MSYKMWDMKYRYYPNVMGLLFYSMYFGAEVKSTPEELAIFRLLRILIENKYTSELRRTMMLRFILEKNCISRESIEARDTLGRNVADFMLEDFPEDLGAPRGNPRDSLLMVLAQYSAVVPAETHTEEISVKARGELLQLPYNLVQYSIISFHIFLYTASV